MTMRGLHEPGEWRQWAGLLAGPVAWAVDLLLSYALVQWACGGGHPAVLRIITLFSLAVIAAGALAAWQTMAASPDGASLDGSRPDDRGRFMGLLGLLACALFTLVVIAAAIPRWALDACES